MSVIDKFDNILYNRSNLRRSIDRFGDDQGFPNSRSQLKYDDCHSDRSGLRTADYRVRGSEGGQFHDRRYEEFRSAVDQIDDNRKFNEGFRGDDGRYDRFAVDKLDDDPSYLRDQCKSNDLLGGIERGHSRDRDYDGFAKRFGRVHNAVDLLSDDHFRCSEGLSRMGEKQQYDDGYGRSEHRELDIRFSRDASPKRFDVLAGMSDRATVGHFPIGFNQTSKLDIQGLLSIREQQQHDLDRYGRSEHRERDIRFGRDGSPRRFGGIAETSDRVTVGHSHIDFNDRRDREPNDHFRNTEGFPKTLDQRTHDGYPDRFREEERAHSNDLRSSGPRRRRRRRRLHDRQQRTDINDRKDTRPSGDSFRRRQGSQHDKLDDSKSSRSDYRRNSSRNDSREFAPRPDVDNRERVGVNRVWIRGGDTNRGRVGVNRVWIRPK